MATEVKIVSYYYQSSDSVVAQGKKQIQRYEKEGYYKKYGGNGSFRMVRPSVAEITVEVDGNNITRSVKGLIRDHYKVQNVTRAKFEEFLNDCESGDIKLKSDGSSITI